MAPDDSTRESDSDDFKLHAVQSKELPPVMWNVEVEGRNLSMELDTGAAFSVISELTKFADLPLRESAISLQSYMSERIPIVGQLNIHAVYGEQKAKLVLLVIYGQGSSLFG